MRFFYDPLKTAQAAAHLVKLHGGQINILVLLKLLYLADRQALIESGYPITGDEMVSMPHGPVLSRIYDCIQWGDDVWQGYISERNNHEVSLKNEDPDSDELSEYEIAVLDNVHQKHGALNWWQIRQLTHDLPEYVDPQGSSLPIDPADILRLAGKSAQDIEVIAHEAQSAYLVGQIIKAGPVQE